MSWISMPRWGINGQKRCMVSEKMGAQHKIPFISPKTKETNGTLTVDAQAIGQGIRTSFSLYRK
jgi:hypothetical protein